MLHLNSWWLDASKCRKLGMLQNQKQYMNFERKKKKKRSPKNSETRRSVAGARDHLLSFAVFWMVMQAWSVQVLMRMDYVVINSNKPSISRHKQVTS
jgi:hypothetical protein